MTASRRPRLSFAVADRPGPAGRSNEMPPGSGRSHCNQGVQVVAQGPLVGLFAAASAPQNVVAGAR